MVLAASVQSSSLSKFALGKVLKDASSIFGEYFKSTNHFSDWMKNYPDDTLLVHMNIPGTHDSSTWNYTQATQNSLRGITNLNQVLLWTPLAYRCQELPFIHMLNMGVRAFDLRIAFDPTNTTLIFYHAQALLSQKAGLDIVLFGFYQWLDDHPSETIFLSIKYEGSTARHAQNNAAVQLSLYEVLTTPAAHAYFVQKKDELGTLGEARGKIILMRRFDLDQLPRWYTENLPGLHFSPNLWIDNGADFTLVYNTEKNLRAYIEDYFMIQTPFGSTVAENIQWKYNATVAHLKKAASSTYKGSLFWTFASSVNLLTLPPIWPQIQALGNGTEYTPNGGVNHMLVQFLKQQRGNRMGIVMFDFYDQPSDLIETFLSL
ncbi:hypothetical protein TMatcc_005460 [Talaromyces marneffei ATCC 18224]|nr:uncharacterized protein EYB26_005999 [Talaromyces marneffei]QGA18315.1 hypothetical protein EYB26_005999 [Talaromyces marneffei]